MKNTIVMAIVAIMLLPSLASADASGEGYSIRSSAISDTVRIDCIGVVLLKASLNSSFEGWQHSDTGFISIGKIFFRKTLPVTIGRLIHVHSASFRFPVVATIDNYYQIVIDPVSDKRVWIRETDYDTQHFNYFSLTAFEPESELDYIDVFYFTTSGQRKYYSTPHTSTNFGIYQKPREYHWGPNYYIYSHLTVDRQEGDYLFLKEYYCRGEDPETLDWEYKDIGWFRIHDDRGRLMVWPLFEQLM